MITINYMGKGGGQGLKKKKSDYVMFGQPLVKY